MIAQVNTPQRRRRFVNACRGKLCLGALLPLDLALFGASQPWRFYAGPTLALEMSGTTAWLAGHANPEELASFLAFCGCEQVIVDAAECPLPTGWQRETTLTIFGTEPYTALEMPAVDETLWSTLTLETEPAASALAKALYPDRPQRSEDFYSEFCTKRSRGKAVAWTLCRENEIICTVGAYALEAQQGYMACGQTEDSLRGRGIGGRLIVQMANDLAAKGLRPVFLAAPERVHFYTKLGFAKLGELERLVKENTDKP